MDERDNLLKISVIEKVMDKETLEDLYQNEPFVCNLLLENFKSFFADLNFKKLERQLTLLKFLKNKYPIDITRGVVSYIENCPLVDDYRKIIMEWNYQCSDYIKQEVLREYDEEILAMSKKNKKQLDYIRMLNNKKLDFIDNIAKLIVDKNTEV